MKKAEIILALLALISLLMKLTEIPLGGLLFLFSMLILSLLYYPFGFAFFNNIRLQDIFKKESYKGISKGRIFGAIGAGIGLSTVIVGIIFSVMHYPSAGFNLVMGLVLTIIVLGIALFKNSKQSNEFYHIIFIRIAILGTFGVILLFLQNWR